jgi:hypothetical protein
MMSAAAQRQEAKRTAESMCTADRADHNVKRAMQRPVEEPGNDIDLGQSTRISKFESERETIPEMSWRKADRVAFALEFLSQLTTVACGVVLGIATSPRRNRKALSDVLAFVEMSFVCVRRTSTQVCTYSRALTEIADAPPVPVCEAMFACTAEAWADDVLPRSATLASTHALALVVAAATICVAVIVAAKRVVAAPVAPCVASCGLTAAAQPPVDLSNAISTALEPKALSRSRRDARRTYVSQEYDRLVEWTTNACVTLPPSAAEK